MFKRKGNVHPQLPKGWHDGAATSITIKRRNLAKRRGKLWGAGYDLVDQYSGEVIAEYGQDELKHMFQEIINLSQQQLQEAINLIVQALSEHEDSRNGQAIANINLAAYVTLPETMAMTKKEAFNHGYAHRPF